MSTMEEETYSVRLPRPVWSIIASMLSLDDRRKLMETSRDACAGVLDYQADCCRKYLSSESFNFYQQPGKATLDPSDVGLYANGLIRHKFGMDDVHGMREGVTLVMSMLFTAFWDSLKPMCINVTERTHRLVSMMRVALGTFSSRARGKVIGEFLRADIFGLRRNKLFIPSPDNPKTFRFMTRKIRIFSIVHMVLGTIDMSHLLPDEGAGASFFSMMDYRKFCDGFGGFLATLKQIDATVLIPLFEPNALWYNFRVDRALSTLPAQLASKWTASKQPNIMNTVGIVRVGVKKEIEMQSVGVQKILLVAEELVFYHIHYPFCRVPFTRQSAEAMSRDFAEFAKKRMDVHEGPGSVYNSYITTLSKILAIVFRENRLSQKDFINLVSDCALGWSSVFVLMLLASLMEECPETEFLLRSQIFSRKFTPYSISYMLDSDDASDIDRTIDGIAEAYMYTIYQRHFFRISQETTIRLFDVIEKKWSKVQRNRLIQCMTTHETKYFLTLNECPYGCCAKNCKSYNPNVLAFFKHVNAKVPKLTKNSEIFVRNEDGTITVLTLACEGPVNLVTVDGTSPAEKSSDGSQSSAKRAKGHSALY